MMSIALVVLYWWWVWFHLGDQARWYYMIELYRNGIAMVVNLSLPEMPSSCKHLPEDTRGQPCC